MEEYIEHLAKEYERQQNAQIAASQSAYMRDQFAYFGIKTPERRLIEKPFLIKSYLPPIAQLEIYIQALWAKNERDFQLFGLDFCKKYMKRFRQEDISLLEFMVENKSWWDTVDFIAYKLMGQYFRQYPDQKKKYIEKWLSSGNIWLQRSAILFQLKYKDELDTNMLTDVIASLLGSKEFFINKAIGWILREYSRTNPEWVVEFVAKRDTLSRLSKREALRLIT